MKVKFFQIFLIIIFVIIFLIFYKGLQNSNIYIPNTLIKNNIPSFEAKTLRTNKKIDSKNLFKENEFYLINIWASWCIPCRDEHDFLIKLSNQKNVKIIGINYKDKNKNAKNFLKKLKSPYEIVLVDKDGTIAIEWGAYGVPESFLLYNKKIIKKIIGPLNKKSLFEIEKLIK